ncbi:hypothetical protein [Arthrobacter cupressi]|uniref:Uncharacterized protein n=1 Tax=Arthrobacter cupressi TaxID=1045773 RepID=A0A1G8PL64_9MICC|nr:hypothetical protein [Arthrobacter cupressi]SDI92580.1 hypothetical protein SAMN05216555_105199 [Arthrobacter cupressi]
MDAEAHGKEDDRGAGMNQESPEEVQGAGTGRATGEVQESPEGRSARKPAARRKPSSGGILPKVASEDEPGSWGDHGGYDHDAWLKEQRPPHWG